MGLSKRGAIGWLAGAILVMSGAGCGPQEGETGEAPAAEAGTAGPSAGEASPGLIAGTPAGGLRDWVEAILAGTASLADDASADRSAAQRTALDLYITRQEYLEMYYGPSGRQPGTPALGQAVLDAETRFHELLQLLAADPVDPAAVREGTTLLHAQLDRVLAEAGAAGVPAVLPDNASAVREPGT